MHLLQNVIHAFNAMLYCLKWGLKETCAVVNMFVMNSSSVNKSRSGGKYNNNIIAML